MQSLSLHQQHTLAQAIAENRGLRLDYYSFIEIALAAFEDIPGFETTPPTLDLLSELWHIYRFLSS